MSRVAILLLALAACGSDDGDAPAIDAASDAPADLDAATDAAAAADAAADAAVVDAAATDAATTDAAAAIDAPATDARLADATVDAATIDAVPPTSDHHIHINVSNTCVMSVSPLEITIPAGQTAYFDWHNHSVDYAVNVWMSYGGGYLDLATGATWNEPVGHCGTPSVHVEYADISTACSELRFLIRCN